jgi:hypothetical protein
MDLNVEKPVYNDTAFAHIASEVPVSVDFALAMTSAPTMVPTAAPTVENYAWVPVQKEVVYISLALSFPVSKELASTPVMQAVFTGGYAAALGIPANYVSISHINNEAVNRRLRSSRQLAGNSASITFQIQSNSSDTSALEVLESNAALAATEGSLVANVQAQAATRGVLVESLQIMPRQLAAPVITRSDPVVIEVFVMVRSNTLAPTPAPSVPTAVPTTAPSHAVDTSRLSSEEVAAIVICILIAAGVILAAALYLKSAHTAPKMSKEFSMITSDAPVTMSHCEEMLISSTPVEEGVEEKLVSSKDLAGVEATFANSAPVEGGDLSIHVLGIQVVDA